MFKVNDIVKHRSGSLYVIVETPNENCRLEYCSETFYIYRVLLTGIHWVRRSSEMEDGRFTLHERHEDE